MNTKKIIGLILLFTIFMNSCTADNTIEEHLNKNKMDINGTGEDTSSAAEEFKN